MSKLPPYLRRLEQELRALDEDAMLLEQLDGFIAGLLICPELIKPGEWLPAVWGNADGNEPRFDSLVHSAATSIFCSSDQRRRRPGPVRTSTRR